MNRPFYILSGNNGATYIICCNSLKSIHESLKFYKPVNFKGKVLKTILFIALWIIGKLRLGGLKSSTEVNAYCSDIIGQKFNFSIEADCSVLISPTRDKIIVNHHENYFEKFVFGKSYANVKKESEVYKLLVDLKEFAVSEISDIQDGGNFCSFKLKHPTSFKKNIAPPRAKELSKILLEFFDKTSIAFIAWKEYVACLNDKLAKSSLEVQEIIDKINKISAEEVKLPMGLVHRDFKPWNILYGNSPLIYDFEEAILNGPPLEDLLNFYIDPIIRYQSPLQVLQIINSEEIKQAMEFYHQELNLKIPVDYLLITYGIERMLFWESRGDMETSIAYKNLLFAL